MTNGRPEGSTGLSIFFFGDGEVHFIEANVWNVSLWTVYYGYAHYIALPGME
jgi:hypothetical protein